MKKTKVKKVRKDRSLVSRVVKLENTILAMKGAINMVAINAVIGTSTRNQFDRLMDQ